MLIFLSIRFAELSLGLLRIPVHLKFLGDVGTIYMMYWASQKEELCSDSYSDSRISCCYCTLGSDSVFTDYTDYFTLHLILSLAIACTFRKNYIKKTQFREWGWMEKCLWISSENMLIWQYVYSLLEDSYYFVTTVPSATLCGSINIQNHFLQQLNICIFPVQYITWITLIFHSNTFLFLLFSEILSLQRGPESWEQSTDFGINRC